MKTKIVEAIEKKIDRSKWVKWKFSDLCENIVEKVTPKKSDLKKYIGLKHLESGSLRIRKYGKTSDLKGDKLKIYKNDFIFAKRNAYLKRVSIADFDAVASAHSMILRPKLENILPEFISYFLLSDLFWQKAIEISVGSLSPTINWKSLAKQEFFLPKIDKQKEMAELFQSVDEMVEKDYSLLNYIKKVYEIRIEKEIHGVDIKGKFISKVLNELEQKKSLIYLKELGKFHKGRAIPKLELKKNGIPGIRYGELYTEHHNIIRKFRSFISNEHKVESFRIIKNDLLLAGSGETIKEIGKSAVFINDFEAYAGSDILIFRPHDLDGFYLGYLMNSKLVRYQLNKLGTGSTVMHIYNSDLGKIKVPQIEKKFQIQIVKKLELIFESIVKVEKKFSKSKALRDSLINQVFK